MSVNREPIRMPLHIVAIAALYAAIMAMILVALSISALALYAGFMASVLGSTNGTVFGLGGVWFGVMAILGGLAFGAKKLINYLRARVEEQQKARPELPGGLF